MTLGLEWTFCIQQQKHDLRKKNKLDFINIKNFGSTKETVQRMKRQAQTERKYLPKKKIWYGTLLQSIQGTLKTLQ